jgi:hypothetical protein
VLSWISRTAVGVFGVAIVGGFVMLLPTTWAVGATPRVVAVPSGGLHDGQRVRLALTGFLPNVKISITECTSPRQVRPGAGCPDGTEGAVAAVTGSNGAVRVVYVVHQRISGVRCSQCVIEASFGNAIATTPVSFVPGELPFTGWRGQELLPLLGLALLAGGALLMLVSK